MRKKLIVVLVIMIVSLICYMRNVYDIIVRNSRSCVENSSYTSDNIRDIMTSKKDKVVVIDAGHGGNDPGKVGVHNELEKDINLSIAYMLKDKMVDAGFSVLMTRTSDDGLYNIYDKNKKMSDLRKRVEIINTSEAVCLISIHQNSFSSSNERGAQVFYYNTSELSNKLAKFVQKSMKEYHDVNNTRQEKSNGSYYILKKTYKPAIIVECGFLSNGEEAYKLTTKKYQESIATSICNGVVSWANDIIESE